MVDRGFDLEARLAAIEDAGRRRRQKRRPVDQVAERCRFAPPPDGDLPVLEMDPTLQFASDNYLGLTTDHRVTDAARKAVTTIGTGSGSGHRFEGDTVVHHDLERRLADTCGTDRALTFPSGDAALTATIVGLAPDVVFVDEYTTNRVTGGARIVNADVVVYDHCDASALRSKMEERLADPVDGGGNTSQRDDHFVGAGAGVTDSTLFDSTTYLESNDAARGTGTDAVGDVEDSRDKPMSTMESNTPATDGSAVGDEPSRESWLLITDTVFRRSGTVTALEDLCDVAAAFGAWIVVDESHATGLYVDGGGVTQASGLESQVHVQLGTLAASLASQGGFVAGSDAFVRCLLAGTVDSVPGVDPAGITPSAAATASEALHVTRYGSVRERLWDNVSHLRDGLRSLGFEVNDDSQILSVSVGDQSSAIEFASRLRERGVNVRTDCLPSCGSSTGFDDAASSPTTENRSSVGESWRLSVTPMATHDHDDVVTCLEAFQAVGDAIDEL